MIRYQTPSFYNRLGYRSVAVIIICCFSIASFALSEKEKTDVRLLIDVSGSMKKNDASNLRRPAVDLLIKLLPEESKAGVWTFGQYVNMLVPHGRVDDKWRKLASTKTKLIDSNGLYTNIGGALEKAAYDMTQTSKTNNTDPHFKHLILLTDGMVDISKDPAENEKEWRRIVDDILPVLKSSHYKIHTIALSENADTALLNKLSLATDGIAAVASNADDLMKIFLNALDSAAPQEKLPLQGNAFVVDSSVEEFTALVFPKENSAPVRLQSPDDYEYSYEKENEDVAWVRTDKYDLLTVNRPVEGEWKLLANLDPDSRITIVSDLNLIVKPIDNNALINKVIDLTLLLEENGKKIIRKDLLDVIDVSYSVQRNDGQTWFDTIPTDLSLNESDSMIGVFSKRLDIFNKSGVYEFKVVVDGKSFRREYSHSVEIREPFVVETETQQKNSMVHVVTKVMAGHDDIDLVKTKISARITDPSGKQSNQLMNLTDFDYWTIDIIPKEQGVYQLDLTIDAVEKNGESFQYTPDPIAIKYPDGKNFFSDQEIELKPEKEDVVEGEIESEKQETTATEAMGLENEVPESRLWLYIVLGIANLCVLILAYFAYRMIMGNKPDPEMDGLEELLEEVPKEDVVAKEEAIASEEKTQKPEKLPTETPSMSEVDSAQPEGESQEQIDDEEVEGITDVEFSLNDFDDDELDSLIDKELEAFTEQSSEVDEPIAEESDKDDGEDIDEADEKNIEEAELELEEDGDPQNIETSDAVQEDSSVQSESPDLKEGSVETSSEEVDDETESENKPPPSA